MRKTLDKQERIELWENNKLLAYSDKNDSMLYLIGPDGYRQATGVEAGTARILVKEYDNIKNRPR